jgi:hypothetical protein
MGILRFFSQLSFGIGIACLVVVFIFVVALLVTLMKLFRSIFVEAPQRRKFEQRAASRGFVRSGEERLSQDVGALPTMFRSLRSGIAPKLTEYWRAEIGELIVWTATLDYRVPERRGASAVRRQVFLVVDLEDPRRFPYLSYQADCPIHPEPDAAQAENRSAEVELFVPDCVGSDGGVDAPRGSFEAHPDRIKEAARVLSADAVDCLRLNPNAFCVEVMGNGVLVAFETPRHSSVGLGDRFDAYLDFAREIFLEIHT